MALPIDKNWNLSWEQVKDHMKRSTLQPNAKEWLTIYHLLHLLGPHDWYKDLQVLYDYLLPPNGGG